MPLLQGQVETQDRKILPAMRLGETVKVKTTLYFDGGAQPTNPGVPYGSFQIETDQPVEYRGLYLTRWRCPFTSKSNNESEYLTLWLALHEVIAKFKDTSRLQIYSDSALVVNQMRGMWKCRDARMQVLRNKCVDLISQAGLADDWSIGWVPREKMVSIFGH